MYWHLPFEVYLIASPGLVVCVPHVLLDSGSDYIVFESRFAVALGLSPPFHRGVSVGTAGGQTGFTLPDDGEVGLLITDYREYYYLPSSPIGVLGPAGPS